MPLADLLDGDKSPMTVTASEWGQHLVIVFTVLIGVSFAQAFSVLGETHLDTSQLLLIATVFYVVFDCWYGFNVNVRYIGATGGIAITFTLLTLVSYSCLPFLYLAHTTSTPSFEPPEILMANLATICILDAIQRTRIFRRNANSVASEEQRWHKKNSYLIVTGFGYGAVLAALTLAFTNWDASVTIRAGIVLALWLVSRLFDYYFIEYLLPKDGLSGSASS